MVEHCPNYDPFYEGCIACPGKFTVKMPNSTLQEICQAGNKKIRELVATADNRIPVFPIRFPAPHDDHEPPPRAS